MNTVRTGIDKRDADMRGKPYLETDIEANRWITFEVQSVEMAGPLESGKPVPAKIRGLLIVKQKPVERTAEGTVTYIKLSPEQVEAQKRFGFTSDNFKVRAKLATTFTDHAMQVPQLSDSQAVQRHRDRDRSDVRQAVGRSPGAGASLGPRSGCYNPGLTLFPWRPTRLLAPWIQACSSSGCSRAIDWRWRGSSPRSRTGPRRCPRS